MNLKATKKRKSNASSKVKEFVASGTGKAKISEMIVESKHEEVLYVAEESDSCVSDDQVVCL